MFRGQMNVRTVWVKDLVVEKKQGKNGEYEDKTVYLNVATDRNYKMDEKQPDGSVKKVVPTDFYLCRAKGDVAQRIVDFCSAKNAEGKTISRRLTLIGHMETYKKTVEYKPSANFKFKDGNVYPITIPHKEVQDRVVFVVEEFEFLDSNPANKNNANNEELVPTIGEPIQVTEETVVQNVETQNTMNPPVEVATQAPVATTTCDEECPF